MKPHPSIARTTGTLLLAAWAAAELPTQEPNACAAALVRFAEAFDDGSLELDRSVTAGDSASAIYGAILTEHEPLSGAGSHRAALRVLVELVGRETEPSGLRALVRLAAVGTERPLLAVC